MSIKWYFDYHDPVVSDFSSIHFQTDLVFQIISALWCRRRRRGASNGFFPNLESFDWGMHPFEAQSVSTSTDYEYRTQRTTPHVCGARSPAEVPLAFTGGSRNAMNHFRQRLRRLLPSAHCRARLDHAWSRNVQVKQPAELPPEIWSTWNSCNTVNVSPSVRAIPHTQTQACATLWNCDLLCLSLFATSMSSITHRFISSRHATLYIFLYAINSEI